MKKNLYEITHYTKSNGKEQKWMIHIEEDNKKAAETKAKELWNDADKRHMFRLSSRKVPLTEIIDMKHWFVMVNEYCFR